MKIKNLETVLPILGFNGDVQISNNLDLTIGFRLQLPEVLSCSADCLYMLHDTFQRMINLLPAGSFIHKQDFFLVNEFHPGKSGSETNHSKASLNKSYLDHFNGRHYLKHECCFYISLLNKGLLKNYLESALILSRKERDMEKLRFDKINELKGNVIAVFQQNGIGCQPITKDQAIGNEHSLGLIERFLSLNFTDNQPVLGGIDFRDRLKVMDQFVEILSLCDYSHIPAELRPVSEHPQTGLSVSLVYPVSYHLPFSHVTNQFIYIPDQQEIKASLEGSYKKIYSLSKFSSENKVNAGLIESFLDQVQTSGEKIVKTHFNVMLFDSSLKDLKQHKSEVASAFSLMNCFPYQHTHDLPLLFFSCVPFSTQLPETELFITQVPQACCLTNFEGELINSESDFVIRLSDRLEGCPVRIDISDEPMQKHLIHNRNKIIIGGSGSGKSFFTNHLLRQYAESENCHIVLLDVGRSYELLTLYLNERLKDQGGAMMVEFTTDNPISFNPFILEGELDIERKQTILSVLYTIYKENLSEMEKDVVAHSVTAFFDSEEITERSFNGYYEFCQSYIPALVREQSIQFNANEFFFILSKYYRGGEYDYLLNRRMDTDEFFRCPFIVFELDNIKDHAVIFPVATLIIIDIFMQKMRRLKGVRKVICIEEAWKAIATPQMASYIKYFYKTIRKFFGEAMVVTQEVDDVISSPVIRDAIINNADTRILLDMSKFRNKFDSISETLGLSEFQKEQILSINKNLPSDRNLKEVFIGLGSYSQVYALEVSKPEYYCYTSEQSEKQRILGKLDGNQNLNFLQILKSCKTKTATTMRTKTTILIAGLFSFISLANLQSATAQTPVTDVGAGIQREALWEQEKGILSEINWYNVLIKVLNGDIKGLTAELVGIDQKKLESLQKVSYLIKDYKRIKQTKEMLSKIIQVYTEKLPKLVQDQNFTTQQAAVIVQSFDLILDDSSQLTTTILNTIIKDDLFMMDDKQRYDTINGIYEDVRRHYGTICYLFNKLLYASYQKGFDSGSLESFAYYYTLYN